MQKILTCELCYVLQECDHLRAVVERQKEEISRLREENKTLRAVMDKKHSSGENQTMFGGSLPSWENAWGYPTTMGGETRRHGKIHIHGSPKYGSNNS